MLPTHVRTRLQENLICCVNRGSQAHGTYVPSSEPNSIDDIDLMTCYLNSRSFYTGINIYQESDHHEYWVGEYDIVEYEIRKLIGLLIKCNPNVLSLLWINGEDIHISSSAYKRLRDVRNCFLSKTRIFESFCGYANGQLKRMTHSEFKGYMGDKRKKLVEKFGYDTKNAAHLIRLLRMGNEMLIDGNLQVKRSDADFLMEIKHGKYPLEWIQQCAGGMFEKIKESYEKSTLPESPDYKTIDSTLLEIMDGI